MGFDAGLGEPLLGAGMNGKDDWNLGSDGVYGAEELDEFFDGVNVGRAMQREDTEALPVGGVFEVEIFAYGGILGQGRKWRRESIDDVADDDDAFARPAFFQEMRDGIFFGDEEIVGEGVGEDAVDLLGHGAIEAARGPASTWATWIAEFDGGQREKRRWWS